MCISIIIIIILIITYIITNMNPNQTAISATFPNNNIQRKCLCKETYENIKQAPFTTFLIFILYTIPCIVFIGLIALNILNYRSIWIIKCCGWSFVLMGLFFYFVWFPVGKQIEETSGTMRYLIMFFINGSVILIGVVKYTSFFRRHFWYLDYFYHPFIYFVEFETILVALLNRTKSIKFFWFSLSNKYSPFVIILYYTISNGFNNGLFILIALYALIYEKLFMESLSISNQNIESIESNRIIKFLINHCKRYAQLPKPQSVIASINQLPQATITIINSNIISSQQQQINNQNENMNSSINTVFDINNMQYRQEIANGWVNLKQDFNQNHL